MGSRTVTCSRAPEVKRQSQGHTACVLIILCPPRHPLGIYSLPSPSPALCPSCSMFKSQVRSPIKKKALTPSLLASIDSSFNLRSAKWVSHHLHSPCSPNQVKPVCTSPILHSNTLQSQTQESSYQTPRASLTPHANLWRGGGLICRNVVVFHFGFGDMGVQKPLESLPS